MSRKILIGLGAIAIALSFTGKTFAQQPTPAATDLPVHTYYKDYRLEGVVLDPDSDPASVSDPATAPAAVQAPAVVAVPEPTASAFLVVASLGAAVLLLRRSVRAR